MEVDNTSGNSNWETTDAAEKSPSCGTVVSPLDWEVTWEFPKVLFGSDELYGITPIRTVSSTPYLVPDTNNSYVTLSLEPLGKSDYTMSVTMMNGLLERTIFHCHVALLRKTNDDDPDGLITILKSNNAVCLQVSKPVDLKCSHAMVFNPIIGGDTVSLKLRFRGYRIDVR